MRLLDAEKTPQRAPDKPGITATTLATPSPFDEKKSERSESLITEVKITLDSILTPQAALLWTWRARLIAELKHRLSSSGESGDVVDGEEYNRSLDTQARAEIMLQEYAAILADRREIFSGERSALAAHDFGVLQPKKKRKRRGAPKEQETGLGLDTEGVEQRPEDDVLRAEMNVERLKVMAGYKFGRSIRKIHGELGAILGEYFFYFATVEDAKDSTRWSST
jgi:E3 ubiquitin-protein ligase SHPRH